MSDTAFDATGFAGFDLSAGTIRTPQGHGLSLLPLDILASLAPTPALRRTAVEWGRQQAESLALNADAQMNAFAGDLRGRLALMGLGRMEVEIRGHALLFRLAAPDAPMTGILRSLVEGFLSGYLQSLKRDAAFEVISIEQSDNETLFFAGNPSACSNLQSWIDGGSAPMAAIERLNREGAER